MAWVVDTSVVLDLVTADPVFEPDSAICLQQHLADGLVVCPVTFAELGPAFQGDVMAAGAFLDAVGISPSEAWIEADTGRAHFLWHQHQLRRRQGHARKRPVADVLIAAFAQRFQGIITRNAVDFEHALPPSQIVVP